MTKSDRDNDYEIYFSHQCDARTFNRGGTKNIGFLAVKNKYPNHYKNITFVFNDIDTIPFTNIFDYETTHGTVKHFYGFKYALGGIVSFKGSDFEAMNGYPNFWGWGMEDNVLQTRCENRGLVIDRTHFHPIGSPNIIQLFDGVTRVINRKDPWRATHDGNDGLQTIHKLNYTIDALSANPADNIHIISSDKIFVINISTFLTQTPFEQDNYFKYDLREPARKIINPDRIKTHTTKPLDHMTDDWSNIPFYPTSDKKKEMIKKYGEKTAKEIIDYSYENSIDPTKEVIPPSLTNPATHQSVSTHQNIHQDSLNQILQKYTQAIRQQSVPYHPNPRQQSVPYQPPNPNNLNKYSPEYARAMGVKPRATTSTSIRLGGLYK